MLHQENEIQSAIIEDLNTQKKKKKKKKSELLMIMQKI
jgi:hypothetical protein